MEAAFPDLLPTSDAAKFLGVPLKERWEHLKPVIVRLFIGPPVHGSKAATLPQLVRFMKEHYQFHAVESEYRTHFRSWGVVKRATEKRKKQAMKALIRRQVPAATVSDVHFKDESTQRQIDSKKWRRYMRDYLRNLHEPLSPGILTSFSLPFEAFVRSLSRFEISRLTGDPSTPYSDASTPEALTVWSPRDPTPAIAGSGQETRDMQLLNQRVKADRTCLFLRGDIIKLASQLELNDQRILVNHFHKFFQHAYSQAKHWDQYDHRSTQTANEVARQLPIPSDLHTMPELAINSPSENSILDSRKPIDQPTALCFWAVHVSPRAVWKEGGLAMTITQDQESKHFPDLLRHAVSTGDFPNSTSGDLPICTEVLVRSVERDPHAMTLDAWRLAIMAGNGDLLWNLFEKEGDKLPAGIDDLYPLHLAAAYLNGGHTCCMIISELWRMCPSGYAYHHDIDSNGLTILDAIFVAILRSHTLLEPNAASYAYQGRFPGEDQDICGRWNPESSAVQALQNAGKPRIPATWKHPFCHTSVQTVCHSILVIYGSPQPPRQNRHSGLFSRICTHCGMRLQLGPIHVVVLAAFFLAEKGRPGETLFGTLAVLVCMMRTGFDASEAVEVSVQDVLGSEGQGLCSHRLMTPAALMESIAYQKIASWSEDCRLGWHCMQAALAHSEVARQRSGDDYPSDSGSNSDFVVEEAITNAEPCILSELDYHDRSFPCADQKEGDLWAVIQAEMLTYRRRADGEAWLSHRFSMKALRDWLTGRTESLETPMVAEDLLQAHSRCGWYLGRHEGTQFPTAEDVSKRYFMNLDVYDRATFLDPQDIEQL